MSRLWPVLCRDVRLAMRQGTESVTVIVFFVLTVVLFPFGLGPEANLLARVAPGVLWVVALLASMLSLDRLFSGDHDDGSLELLTLSPVPLSLLVLVKALAHWLTTGLPLVAVTPLLALLLGLDGSALGMLLLAMMLGTPILSLIGMVGAALTLGSRRSGVLLSLLVLPLYVPVLVFGVATVDTVLVGQPSVSPLLMLGSLLCGAFALCPWVAAVAVRQSIEDA
ncbi:MULTISPECIES: heme exporter protein CcmB [unclassified Haematospirillum]|uniref:heme exporter protein CcmB n=1 Tax=unclassified Haematospirillum TaxID=2622088 RepID=UPI00143A1DEF|nr:MULTISPECIES: heme exporter protein CcmB [unclassified Haematospirillum]NKD55724.1 heme exporter protein CcmB [Haematospirillum sp. H4890]NKD75841.1 heme exporter protein CcmB [Haematospirillum sp. H4485]NKD88106.1 heme exporter protein CcmB [Haematospirillum sp. 15-248]